MAVVNDSAALDRSFSVAQVVGVAWYPRMSGPSRGYAEFLEAIRDPEHKRHDECKTWIGKVFDPTVVDANTIAEQQADLAKR